MSAVFVVTKPLQFMVAASIVEQVSLGDSPKILVVDSFAGASDAVARYNAAGAKWGRAQLLSTVKGALKAAAKERVDEIFIDADVGVQKWLWLLLLSLRSPTVQVNVYEEGVGTYRNDLYGKYKSWVLQKLGVGSVFGGSVFARYVYVYDTDLYRKRTHPVGAEPIELRGTLFGFLRSNRDFLNAVFADDDAIDVGAGPVCTLYLSNWTIDVDFINSLSRQAEGLIVKPHPHIREIPPMTDVKVLPGNRPAELLIMDLLDKYERVIVMHHGSSAAHYLADSKAVFQTI